MSQIWIILDDKVYLTWNIFKRINSKLFKQSKKKDFIYLKGKFKKIEKEYNSKIIKNTLKFYF